MGRLGTCLLSIAALVGFAAVIFATSGCAPLLVLGGGIAGGATVNELSKDKQSKTDQKLAEPYTGPKARIVVADFTCQTSKCYYYPVIGNGLADMLSEALFNTNRFIVLQRQSPQYGTSEQWMGGAYSNDPQRNIGRIEGADIVVTGIVTEFEPATKGVEAYMYEPKWYKRLLRSLKAAHIGLTLRLIDTKTSNILATTSVKGSAVDVVGALSAAIGSMPMDLEGFVGTPNEQAARSLTEKALTFVVTKTPKEYFRYHDATAAINPQKPVYKPEPNISTKTQQPKPKKNVRYVKGTEGNVYKLPSVNAILIAKVGKGEELVHLQTQGDWCKVRLGNGTEGWIQEEIVSINP
jgi:curli biogenesis system outer membrane secretion channel CsgG